MIQENPLRSLFLCRDCDLNLSMSPGSPSYSILFTVSPFLTGCDFQPYHRHVDVCIKEVSKVSRENPFPIASNGLRSCNEFVLIHPVLSSLPQGQLLKGEPGVVNTALLNLLSAKPTNYSSLLCTPCC